MTKSTDNQAAVDRIERDMPSLDHLELSLRPKRDLGKLLGVHAKPTGRGQQIADGYVRLVEKAVLEYREAREKIAAFLADGTADYEYRAQDHFESCVQALHRAIEYLDHLRRFGYKTDGGAPFIPKARDLEVLRDGVRKQVRDMRDAIEHLDKDILQGKLPLNSRVGVHLGWEESTVGSFKLRYTDVARWIGQLHEFAGLLSRVHLTLGPAPETESTPTPVGDKERK